jgi:hypothetical protein
MLGSTQKRVPNQMRQQLLFGKHRLWPEYNSACNIILQNLIIQLTQDRLWFLTIASSIAFLAATCPVQLSPLNTAVLGPVFSKVKLGLVFIPPLSILSQ